MSKILLHSVELAGFRAYLSPQIIELHSKNLAIFAPNGRGKSSLADAIEFYLSPAMTLPKFGEIATGNQAGYTALAHNAAEKAGIKPSVTLKFKASGETFGSARHPDGRMPRTEAGNRVAAPTIVLMLSFEVMPSAASWRAHHLTNVTPRSLTGSPFRL